ncbi:MAG: type II secretion system GspH family protein [bacterium]|nr:type II secretion system GspH family protein [bacterium]
MLKFRQFLSNLKNVSPGFTMIELLVVIAVIGVLAVAVLSSINPIEQINKGRDTRTRSDAAQLINAVDRYYAIHEAYPWNVASAVAGWTPPAALVGPDGAAEAFTFDETAAPGATSWNWVDVLVSTAEVKDGFTNRVKNDNNIVVFKEDGTNTTMYACFVPTSLAFQQEAADNCLDGTTPDDTFTSDTGDSIDPCGGTALTNFICLP